MTPSARPSRRDVLRSTGAAALASAVVPSASAARRAVLRPEGSEVLTVGLVGCGGRGTGAAANALRADPNVKLFALGDTFADRLGSSPSTLPMRSSRKTSRRSMPC